MILFCVGFGVGVVVGAVLVFWIVNRALNGIRF